jgi:hypothetical protein
MEIEDTVNPRNILSPKFNHIINPIEKLGVLIGLKFPENISLRFHFYKFSTKNLFELLVVVQNNKYG